MSEWWAHKVKYSDKIGKLHMATSLTEDHVYTACGVGLRRKGSTKYVDVPDSLLQSPNNVICIVCREEYLKTNPIKRIDAIRVERK